MFKNRKEAGMLLAKKIKAMHLKSAVVLAIPRGGIVIGCEIAEAIDAELDIIAPRKLSDPYEPELAIGAVMPDGSTFLNQEIIETRNIPMAYIEKEKQQQMGEANRRMASYRGERKYPAILNRKVIIADDGIATGSTMIVAARWIRKKGASSIIITVPVMPDAMQDALRREADELVYLAKPMIFYGVGQFYTEFEQINDSEAVRLLDDYWQKHY